VKHHMISKETASIIREFLATFLLRNTIFF